jgi:hypothetical protein
MPDDRVAPTFAAIGELGQASSLRRVTGSIKVELGGKPVQRWLVQITRGNVAVSRRNIKADCVIRCSREQFERFVDGRANLMASVLRGVVEVEGDWALLLPLKRLLAAARSSA